MIFIRPWALILLLVPFFIRFLNKKMSNPWKKYIDARLLPYLLVKKGTSVSRFKWFFLAWSALVFALAGPAYEKIAVPQIVDVPATVIVLDLNTISPTMLPSVKIKMLDILKALKADKVALVLYDEKGYVAVPLTQDKIIIEEMIPILSQEVLPAVGNQAQKGFEKAVELLQNESVTAGRILFITGGADTQALSKMTKNTPWKVGVLGVANTQTQGEPLRRPDGSFLRNSDGQVILSYLNEKDLAKLGAYASLSVDDKDFTYLLDQTKTEQLFSNHKELSFLKADIWRDMGVYILLIILPFLAFIFRRGVFLSVLFLIAFPCYAGIWQRADQIAYDNMQKGISAYRAGAYEQAQTYFEQSGDNPNALYNKANALAHQGNIQGAIDLYDKVLEQVPEHNEALYNKSYLEEQLKKQQQQTQSSQDNSEDDSAQESSKQSENDSKDAQNDTSQDNNENNTAQENPEQSENGAKESQNDMQSGSDDNEKNAENNQSNATPNLDQTGKNQIENTSSKESENNKEVGQNLDLNDLQDSQEKQDGNQNEDSFQDVNDKQNHQKEKNESETMPDTTDQVAQEIYNKLKKDPSRLLRYRLYEQYRRMP